MRTERDRRRPAPPSAPVLTVRTEGDEYPGETGDNARVQMFVYCGAKGERGAEASPFPSPAALPPAVVLRFWLLPYLATEGT